MAEAKYDIRSYIRPSPPALKTTGAFDLRYSWNELTTVIGREYPDAPLTEILDSVELLKDLAIIVSQRGVVIFRHQSLSPNDQKRLAQALGEATGKPSSSSLHIHPMMNQGLEEGLDDNQISVISSQHGRARYKERFAPCPGRSDKKASAARFWHNDTSFENVPSDYTVLKIAETPEFGGDTLWASGSEMYQRLSVPFQEFFKTLTVTFNQPVYKLMKDTKNIPLYYGERGSPSNVSTDFEAIHPLVRSNPVTGNKSIYGFGQHAAFINNVTEAESEALMGMIKRTLTENHDLQLSVIQVRVKWSKDDVAIWDNRSVFHTATYDHDGPRVGIRAVGIGEAPFLDN